MLFISIPTPCHEKWNEMSPNEKGAFCNVCSKTVVDFTSLSDEEVKNYFFQNGQHKTCGRFRNDQLTNPDDPLPRLLAQSIPFWKKFLAIVLFVFGSFLTGCHDETIGKMKMPEVTGVVISTIEQTPEVQNTKLINDTDTLTVVELETTMGIPDLPMPEEVRPLIEVQERCPVMGEIVELDKIMLDENGCEVIDPDKN